tara:strand:+ start:657 stop:1388 length:732 start_codon:yes stop_codon:yes gene_type:complete
MGLPKLNSTIHETILPSTEQVVKYRPFLVKEEKILLTAMESEDEKSIVVAVKQILKNCIQGDLNIDELPTFDVEFMFLRLRAKSVGEKITVGLKPYPCVQNEGELCKFSTEVEINLEEVQVVKNEKHSSKIMINDDIGIKLKYPDINVLKDRGAKDQSDMEMGMSVIKNCIDMIFTKEETHERGSFTEEELDEFVDSLNSEQFKKVKEFFDTIPKLSHTIEYTCKTCGEEKKTTIEGLSSFFG